MNWQKTFWLTLLVIASIGYIDAQYINEFHYSNSGADANEFIEVVIPDPQPVVLSEYKIYLYNGANGEKYGSRGLQGIIPECSGGVCYYVWTKQPFIQNGPDGIAFLRETTTDTTLFDFISYGGTVMAMDGGAIGATSTDIGIEESNSTPIGYSLQKGSNGIWFAGPQTRGSINPIELITFEGWYRNNLKEVLLQWSTASESNNHYFEVQRSSDQRLFLPLGEVTGVGNSQEIQKYSLFDTDPFPGVTYYRLKQVDFGGAYCYSRMIEVESPSSSSFADLVPIFHNGVLYFKDTGYNHSASVSIYNSTGKILFYRKEVRGGEVIPVFLPVDQIIFYQIRSQGLEHSGPLNFNDR